MYLHNLSKTRSLPPFPRKSLSTSTDFQKSIQVCILGAETPLGRTTSFLIKQNPLISILKLHGESRVDNLVIDLGHMDTRCKALAFEGNNEISKALRGVDVVLMLGNQKLAENTSIADRILAEGKRVYDLANECINFAPRSIIVVNVPPVSVTTPIVAGAYKKTHWYHPGRIVGSAALAQIKANSILGRYQGLDSRQCQVPILGGPDLDIAVPLFSRAKPIELNDLIAQGLFARFRGLREDQFPKITSKDNYVENCPLSEAFALNSMITAIGMGICGDNAAFCNAFLRTNALNTCEYLVTTLQFSRGGVIHNFGIPLLTKLELRMFEEATLKIKERQDMANEYLQQLHEGDSSTPSFKVKETERQKLLQQNILTS